MIYALNTAPIVDFDVTYVIDLELITYTYVVNEELIYGVRCLRDVILCIMCMVLSINIHTQVYTGAVYLSVTKLIGFES